MVRPPDSASPHHAKNCFTTNTLKAPLLSPEILQNVIDHVDRSSVLKNLRLTNKFLAHGAERHLFKSMILVPYRDCLEGFASFMRSNPQIARNVQKLDYDARSRLLSPGRSYSWLSHETTDAAKHLQREALHAGRAEEESNLLAKCLRLLPSLRALVITEMGFEQLPPYTSPLPSLYSAYFNRFPDPDGTVFLVTKPVTYYPGGPTAFISTTKIALQALKLLTSIPENLTELRINNGQPNYLLRNGLGPNRLDWWPQYIEANMFETVLGKIKRLSLSLEVSLGDIEMCREEESQGPQNLWQFSRRQVVRNILCLAHSVEYLHLDGMDAIFYRTHSNNYVGLEQSWLAPLLRNEQGQLRETTPFPHLKHLTLGRMICGEDELTTFAKLHRRTLEKFHLSDITLIEIPERPAGSAIETRVCWVRALRVIRSCSIPQVTLAGRFTNQLTQSWHVRDAKGNLNVARSENWSERELSEIFNFDEHFSLPESRTLKKRMEEWLSGRGEGNFPIAPTPRYPFMPRGDASWIFQHPGSGKYFTTTDEPDDDAGSARRTVRL